MEAREWAETLVSEAELVRRIIRSLEESHDELDRILADYLAGAATIYEELPPLVLLGAITKPKQPVHPGDQPPSMHFFFLHSKKDAHTTFPLKAWGAAFISELLVELRLILCGRKKQHGKISNETQAAIAMLATAISQKLGLQAPTSVGLAVLAMLCLVRASKKAFCKVTDKEVIKALLDS